VNLKSEKLLTFETGGSILETLFTKTFGINSQYNVSLKKNSQYKFKALVKEMSFLYGTMSFKIKVKDLNLKN